MLNYTPCARSSHGLSAIAGKAYLFGGEAKARQAIDSVVHCLDVTKGWKTLEVGAGKVPPPRVGHAQCTMRNEVLMVFGGRTCEKMGEGNLNDLWSYNPLNNDWTQMEGHGSVPEPRSFHAATAIGDKLFVFGGCGAKGRLADLHEYDVKERVNHAICDELLVQFGTHTHTHTHTRWAGGVHSFLPPSPFFFFSFSRFISSLCLSSHIISLALLARPRALSLSIFNAALVPAAKPACPPGPRRSLA
jgi:N-acetylneuraminic acid mutarotase